MDDHGIRHLTIQPKILIILGFIFVSIGFGSSPTFASSALTDHEIYRKSQVGEHFFLAQQGGPPDCQGPRHGGRDNHCPEMRHGGGCPGGKRDCPGRKGRGHRGGMGRGMHHGGGEGGPAQCPQPRATVKAPDEFYNRTNPVENTPDNVEKGRLLFQLDAQPTCVMCHGSQGDGTGGFGANLSPSPRNFTCTETMKDISDGQLFWIIRNGSPDTGMPPFQDLQDEQTWELMLFIRSLAR
jgi:mono/diheme cytochrome c family protein